MKAVRQFLNEATESGKATDWAVVLPSTTGRKFPIPELGGEVPIVKRKRRSGQYGFVGSDPRHREAVAQIARGESVPGLGASSTRGVIFIYITPDRDPDTGPINRSELVGLIAVAAPTSSIPNGSVIKGPSHVSTRATTTHPISTTEDSSQPGPSRTQTSYRTQHI